MPERQVCEKLLRHLVKDGAGIAYGQSNKLVEYHVRRSIIECMQVCGPEDRAAMISGKVPAWLGRADWMAWLTFPVRQAKVFDAAATRPERPHKDPLPPKSKRMRSTYSRGFDYFVYLERDRWAADATNL